MSPGGAGGQGGPTSQSTVLAVGVERGLQLGVALHQEALLLLQARLDVQVLLRQAAVGGQGHLPLQLDVLDLQDDQQNHSFVRPA